MTSATLSIGMRVVVRDGPWPDPRIAGHYGKVAALAATESSDDATIHVAFSGHVDGGAPDPMMLNDPLMQWFFPEELEVVD